LKSNIFNEDFQDFLYCLEKLNVEYVLVGGYAVIIHGYHRTTGDMDIFVNCTEENYLKLVRAFNLFGMPIFGMTLEKFLDQSNYDVFVFGRPPVSIDILTKIKGSSFNEVVRSSMDYQVDENLKIKVVTMNQLIKLKKSSSRYKDLNDIENLEGLD